MAEEIQSPAAGGPKEQKIIHPIRAGRQVGRFLRCYRSHMFLSKPCLNGIHFIPAIRDKPELCARPCSFISRTKRKTRGGGPGGFWWSHGHEVAPLTCWQYFEPHSSPARRTRLRVACGAEIWTASTSGIPGVRSRGSSVTVAPCSAVVFCCSSSPWSGSRRAADPEVHHVFPSWPSIRPAANWGVDEPSSASISASAAWCRGPRRAWAPWPRRRGEK